MLVATDPAESDFFREDLVVDLLGEERDAFGRIELLVGDGPVLPRLVHVCVRHMNGM